jgi:hypothetical protein
MTSAGSSSLDASASAESPSTDCLIPMPAVCCMPTSPVSLPDLCRTIGETLASPSKLRLALRRRLERLLRDGNLAQRDREHVHDPDRANPCERPRESPPQRGQIYGFVVAVIKWPVASVSVAAHLLEVAE